MNSREITEVSIKLKGILDAMGQGGLESIAREIESEVLKPFGMFDSTVVMKMKNSKDRIGHYTIQVEDTESIKSIKAVINILRSTSAATNTVINPAVEGVVNYLKTGSKVGAVREAAVGVIHVTSNYIGAKWADLWRPTVVENDGRFNLANLPAQNSVDQALQLVGDVSAVKFYLGQIREVLPNLTGISTETQQTLIRLQNVLDDTVVMNAAVAINDLTQTKNAMGGAIDLANAATQKSSVTGIDRSLQAVKEAAANAMDEGDRIKYYDKKRDKFILPTTGSSDVSSSHQQLMIAYNVTDRARKAIARVNEFVDTWNKTKSLPLSQLPAMLEIINKIGKMVKETQQLNNSELGQLIKKDLDEAIKQVLTTVGSTLPQLAAIAQETELKIGLRDNTLLSNIEKIATQYESVAKSYHVPVTVKYPYPEQKNIVIKNLQAEAENKIAKLRSAIHEWDGRDYRDKFSLQDLTAMQQQAALIKTPAGGELSKEIVKVTLQVTGMDKLINDIKKAEDKLYDLTQVSELDQDVYYKIDMKESLSALKELYGMRDQLQSQDAPVQHYVSNESGIGELKPGIISISATKAFKTAASAAVSDAQGLVVAESNMIDRLTKIGDDNRKLLGPSKETKLNRLNAMHGVKSGSIATMRGQLASENRQSRDASYANIQRKVTKFDENAIVQAVISQKKGAVIVQCEAGRKTIMESAKNYLDESQLNSLNEKNKKNGIYEVVNGDGLLVMNAKQMNNILVRLEELMSKVNQVSSYIEAGGLSYLKIAGIIPGMQRDMKNLLHEVKAGNATLIEMRQSLSHTLSAELQKSMDSVIQTINRNFPDKLLLICCDVETEVLNSIDPAYAAKSHELFAQAKSFILNADSLLRNGSFVTPSTAPSNEVQSGQFDVGMINAMIDILQKKIEGGSPSKRRSGQLYKLADFKSGTPEMSMAGLSNALTNLSGSLQATVKISKTKGMLGGVDLIKNLYGVYASLAEATPGILNAMQPQIKAMLESVDSVMAELFASAAVTEKTFGLKEKSLTATMEPIIKMYEQLASTYGANLKEPAPYHSAQMALMQDEHRRLLNEKQKPEANTALVTIQIERMAPMMLEMRARMEEGAVKATIRTY